MMAPNDSTLNLCFQAASAEFLRIPHEKVKALGFDGEYSERVIILIEDAALVKKCRP